MKLYIDDIRTPVTSAGTIDTDWFIARTEKEAIRLIEVFRDDPELIISFDHDLGSDPDNPQYQMTTRAIINHLLTQGMRPTAATVHSSNPVGAAWLNTALDRDFGEPVPRIDPIPFTTNF